MAQQLIYTSAPAGLKPGSHGYCTVAESKGLPQNLARQLESLSGYKHLHKPGDSKNPIGFSHVRLRVGGKTYQVISRVSDAGLDHTSRSNLLAQHIALEASELPRGGPAWLLGQPQIMRDAWKEEPRTLDPLAIPQGGDPASACQAWQHAAGDALWGGVLANAAVQPKMGTVTIIYPLGTDVLRLLREALALVPESRRWEVTFNTYFSKAIPGLDCHWRFVPAGTPQAEAAKRDVRTEVIDLTSRSQPLPSGDFVSAAQQGHLLELPQAVGRPGKGAPPESSGPTPGRRPPGQGEIAGNQPPAPIARGPASPGKNPPPRPPERGFDIAALPPAGQMLHGSKPLADRSPLKSSRNRKPWYSSRIVVIMFVLLFGVLPILAIGGVIVWHKFPSVAAIFKGNGEQRDVAQGEGGADDGTKEAGEGTNEGGVGDGTKDTGEDYKKLVALLDEHHNAFENMNKTDASKYAEDAKTLLKQVCQNSPGQSEDTTNAIDSQPEETKECKHARLISELFEFNFALVRVARTTTAPDSDGADRVKDLANCYAELPTLPDTPSPSDDIEGFAEAVSILKKRSKRLEKDILEQYEQCVADFATTQQKLIALKKDYPVPKETPEELQKVANATADLKEFALPPKEDREQIKALQNASGNTDDVITTLKKSNTFRGKIQKQIEKNQRYLTLRVTDNRSGDEDHNLSTIPKIEKEIKTLSDAPPQDNSFDKELLARYKELLHKMWRHLMDKKYVDLAGKVKDNGSPVVLRPIPEALGGPLKLALWPEGAGYSIEKSSDTADDKPTDDHWVIERHGHSIAEITLEDEEQETDTGRRLEIVFDEKFIKSPDAFKTGLRDLAGRFLVVRFKEHPEKDNPDKPVYICLGPEQSSLVKCEIRLKLRKTTYTPAELSAADQKLIELYTAKGWKLRMEIEPPATLNGKGNFTKPVTVEPAELAIYSAELQPTESQPTESQKTESQKTESPPAERPHLAFAIEGIFGKPTIRYRKKITGDNAERILPKWEFESIVFGLEEPVGEETIRLQELLENDFNKNPKLGLGKKFKPFSSRDINKFTKHIQQLHSPDGSISPVTTDYQDQINDKNRLQQTNRQAIGEHKGNQRKRDKLEKYNSRLEKEKLNLRERKQMLESYQKETVPDFWIKILKPSASNITFSFRLSLKGTLPDSEREGRVSLSIGGSD